MFLIGHTRREDESCFRQFSSRHVAMFLSAANSLET